MSKFFLLAREIVEFDVKNIAVHFYAKSPRGMMTRVETAKEPGDRSRPAKFPTVSRRVTDGQLSFHPYFDLRTSHLFKKTVS